MTKEAVLKLLENQFLNNKSLKGSLISELNQALTMKSKAIQDVGLTQINKELYQVQATQSCESYLIQK